MKRTRVALAAGLLTAALSAAAWAAGMFSTLPIVGGPSFCASTVTGTGGLGGATGQGQGTTGSICGQTVPAGPGSVTGVELIPADTGLSGGAPPQTVAIPTSMLGNSTNRLIGGDFNTNLWQRGTTPVSSATPSTAVMAADRWFAYSSGNTVSVIKETGSTDTIASLGLYASMRVSRPSGTNTSQICVGQVLDKQAAAPLIGNNAILSFWALDGAGLAAVDTNGVLAVTVAYFTAADATSAQSAVGAAGTNTLSFATGTTTGYTAAVGGVSPGTTGTVASGVASIPTSTTWTRYAVYAPIPTVNASGTAITALGVSICYTPASGTGGSTEWFELAGVQLEGKPSTATPQLANGVISPTAFERRYPAVEAQLQQAYSYVVNESASVVNFRGVCGMSTTSLANCAINFPVTMRIVPAMKYTAGFESCTTTACTAASACTALTTSATLTGSAATQNSVLVDCASSGAFSAAGSAGFLWDSGTVANGVISASAEP